MKLGEIKLEAINLMFVSYNSNPSIEDLENLENDENYGFYISNMAGAINRAFSAIEEKRILPQIARKLTDGESAYGRVKFTLPSNLYDIDRITYADEFDYQGNVDFMLEGDTIIIPERKGDYSIIYYPKITRVSSLTDEETEIAIPDTIASLIPYYIKGDLYRDDEPQEASEARNWFEQMADAMREKLQSKTSKVEVKYRLEI